MLCGFRRFEVPGGRGSRRAASEANLAPTECFRWSASLFSLGNACRTEEQSPFGIGNPDAAQEDLRPPDAAMLNESNESPAASKHGRAGGADRRRHSSGMGRPDHAKGKES